MKLPIKILSAVCILFLLKSSLLSQVFHLSIPAIKKTSGDTTVVVPVIVSENLTGKGITSYTAEIEWDNTVIDSPTVSQTGTLTEPWGSNNFFQNYSTPGKLIFGQFVVVPALEGSGTLVNLIFIITGPPGCSTTIAINIFVLNGIEAITSNGSFALNTPPTANTLAITPAVPKTTDDLVGSYIYYDAEEDPEDSTEIRWYNNNVLKQVFQNQLIVPGSATTKGEQWRFTVMPRDNMEFGAVVTSSIVTIANTKPAVDNLSIFPPNPKTSDNLVGNYSYFDIDMDTENGTEISWFKNGILQPAYKNQSITPDSATAKGEQWYFTVQPHDGEEFGAPSASPTVTISNTAPLVDSLKIFPSNPLDIDSLVGSYIFYDIDSDVEEGSEIRWYKNNEVQIEYNDVLIIPATFTAAGEQWYFTIKPGDGTDLGNLQVSATVKIGASAFTANFSADTTAGIDSLTVQFTDLSQGPITHWHWDFGDGDTAAIQNPTHEYTSIQKYYTVSLTIQGPGGTETMIKKDYVSVYKRVSADLIAYPIIGKDSLTVLFTNNSEGDADQYVWDFGDGTTLPVKDSKLHPNHFYDNNGNYSVSLKSSGNGGADSVLYKNLIYVDEFAAELVLVNSGVAEPDNGWANAIDNDVFTKDGVVVATIENAWAIFAFTDSVERNVTNFRFKRSSYHTLDEQQKAKAFEVFVSTTGTSLNDFKSILSGEFSTDDWITYEISDSSIAKYILLKILSTESSQRETCEFAEFQVFGVPQVVSDVIDSDNVFSLNPTAFSLAANYPNPFNPHTIIEFKIAETATAEISIYNIKGQIVRVLTNDLFEGGTYHTIWNGLDEYGSSVGSGVYICKMQVINKQQKVFSFTRKMILIR